MSTPMNDLGLPAFSHWEMFQCDLTAPGDIAVDEVQDVDCPECLKRFKELRDRQIKARGRGVAR